MTVKCERGIIWMYIMIMPAPIYMFFVYYNTTSSLKEAFLWLLPLVLVYFIFPIPALLCLARTFVFNKDGCTIELLGYRKMIPWSRIKYIRIESYPSYEVSYVYPYSGGIFFSTKRFSKMSKLFYLFSHICVYFEANPPVKYTRFNYPRYPREWCVDENTFINLLKEWNVPLPEKVKITRDRY